MAQARSRALKAASGAVESGELEHEPGGSGLRYSFDIRTPGGTREVGIDALTGKVLENSRESTATEAREQAAGGAPSHYTMTGLAKMQVPGHPLRSFAVSAVDPTDHVYALSDRSNRAVDLFDTRTHKFVGRATGFSGDGAGHGHGKAGPNGIVAVGKQLWAGDGNSTVKIVNVSARKVVANISTGGSKRVDELAFDPRDHLVVAANNADHPPLLTFMSTRPGHHVTGRLRLPRATDGLEQPVWDPANGMVYVAVPQVGSRPARGGIAEIKPRTRKLRKVYPVHKCMPAGLALGPHDHLMIGCSDDAIAAGFPAKSLVMDARNGRIVAPTSRVGGSDEVWYDSKTRRYYLAAVANPGGPVLGMIDANADEWIGNIRPGPHAHSVAASAATGEVFVPIAAGKHDTKCPAGCVLVYGTRGSGNGG